MPLGRTICAIILVLCTPLAASAQDVAASSPESLGFSAKRLSYIRSWYQAQIDAGALPGAVVAIARNGKIAYLEAVGTQDHNKTTPLKADAIFWIASMTKPITSVAAMMLSDQGKLDLTAPVYRYLPELEAMQVAVERPDPATGTSSLVREPQKRPMTVLDLLRHTSGLIYPEEGATTVYQLYRRALSFRRDETLAEFVSSLAKLPLAHQPGEVWEYSLGVDVLARVIEVVSGQPFDRFLEDRIFKPLGMIDTGFYVPTAKLSRLVDPPPSGRPALWDMATPPKLFSGGGGLVSTARDYLRFCQMLLNGGELDGVRILSASTVQRMTTSSLPPQMGFAGGVGKFLGPRWGSSWGLGFAVRTDPNSSLVPGAVGSFTWGGLWGTKFWIDPAERLVVVQLIQIESSDDTGQYTRALRYFAYGALRAPDEGSFARPTTLVSVGAKTLGAYVGRYVFDASIARSDRRGPFPGVGMEIALQDGIVKVRAVYPSAPAARAGVLVDDVITHIDHAPIGGMPLDQVLERLAGRPDTQVNLTIRHGETPIDVSMLRKMVRVPGAELQVRVGDGELVVEATGAWPILDFDRGRPHALRAISASEFYVDGGDHTRLAFIVDGAGKATSAILNPGPWELPGFRAD
jgi:CubicO group peptidase (beta-lactamase class C family)